MHTYICVGAHIQPNNANCNKILKKKTQRKENKREKYKTNSS
jgi:hypothetical protein